MPAVMALDEAGAVTVGSRDGRDTRKAPSEAFISEQVMENNEKKCKESEEKLEKMSVSGDERRNVSLLVC